MEREKIRTYQELCKLKTFEDRFNYLKLYGNVGVETFGYDRYLNQKFYRSKEWRQVRHEVIARDNGCDLGIDGLDIYDGIFIHHMNPLSIYDLEHGTDFLFCPDYLISVSAKTHNALHYGSLEDILHYVNPFEERKPNDTCPWKG